MKNRLAAHELNHKNRRSLQWQTACRIFSVGKKELKAHNYRQRKEVFDWIRAMAIEIMAELGTAGKRTIEIAWRLAVETWSQQNGLITTTKKGKVLPGFHEFWSHD